MARRETEAAEKACGAEESFSGGGVATLDTSVKPVTFTVMPSATSSALMAVVRVSASGSASTRQQRWMQ